MAITLTDYLTVTPTRVVDDAENTRVPIAPIDCVPILHEPQPVLSERGKRWTQTGDLFVRRGADLKEGDQITLPQGVFGVVGDVQWDQNHAMNGHDFGWVLYAIRKGG